MKYDLIGIAIGFVIFAAGCVLACRAIGGGKGQHKGDPQPFRRRTPAPDALDRLTAQHAAASALPPPVAEVPFTAEVEASPALERAAKLLPPEFDPKVDSLVGGIPAVPADGGAS